MRFLKYITIESQQEYGKTAISGSASLKNGIITFVLTKTLPIEFI